MLLLAVAAAVGWLFTGQEKSAQEDKVQDKEIIEQGADINNQFSKWDDLNFQRLEDMTGERNYERLRADGLEQELRDCNKDK